MSEQAEYLLEQAMKADWYDYEEEVGEEKQAIKCKYCKRRRFYWGRTEEGNFRLFTSSGKIHECQAYFKRLLEEKE